MTGSVVYIQPYSRKTDEIATKGQRCVRCVCYLGPADLIWPLPPPSFASPNLAVLRIAYTSTQGGKNALSARSCILQGPHGRLLEGAAK